MKHRALWLAVLILLVAFSLRIWHLNAQGLWFDEGFSWHVATQPTLLQTWTADRQTTNPPLYHALLHIWIRLVGDSEVAMRSFSLLEGMLLLALTGAAARHWFNRQTGLLALAIGMPLPVLWWGSQEVRMYNTLGLAVLIVLLGLIAVLQSETPSRRAWLALLGGELAALYTHNSGVTILGAVNVVVGIVLGLRFLRTRRMKPIARWVAGQFLVVLCWLPELMQGFANVDRANAASAAPPAISLELLWQSWQALWASSWAMVLAKDSGLSLVAILLIPLGILALTSLRTRNGRIILGFTVAWYAILLVALTAIGINFHGRYMVTVAPLIVIAVAAGLTLAFWGRRWITMAGVAVTLAVLAVWLRLPGSANPAYQHDQVREMAAYYARELGPDDLVLTWSYARRYELVYYWQHMDIAAQLVTLPEGADADTVVGVINEHLTTPGPVRVEVNTWYTQPGDRRNMLRCLLGDSQPVSTETLTVYGMSTTAYRPGGMLALPNPTPISPVIFGPLQVTGDAIPSSARSAEQGLCLPLTVVLTNPTDSDLRAAVHILNSDRQEIASAEPYIMDAGQNPTSRLAAGTTVSVYPLIYLPPGTPPGEYPVSLRIFSETAPDGLDIQNPVSGAPMGKDALLGSLVVRQGTWEGVIGDCAMAISSTITLTNCAGLQSGMEIAAGEALFLTFRWQIDGSPQPITINLEGDGWQIADTAIPATGGLVLDWRRFAVPADADGPATLAAQIGDASSVVLAEYTVETPEHRMMAPGVSQPISIDFPGVGRLYGFDLSAAELTGGQPVPVKLIWQAEGATAVPYTVSVQLLDASGNLLAQHDSLPVGGQRPTTGWVPGEYLTDEHVLTFREETRDYTGRASLIVVVYDPVSGDRVVTADGAGYATLTDDLTIRAP